MNTNLATVFQASRPKFLLLGPLCVLLGISMAFHQQSVINVGNAALCLLLAVFSHISVNLFNEYHDAKTGLDDNTIRTPFSGGSGALQIQPNAGKAVIVAAWISALISVVLGLYLALNISLWLVALGIMGMILVLAYTPWLNQSPWLCLIAPGFGFGLIMVLGSYVVLVEHIEWQNMLIALPVFALTNNLLLLNQFPDAAADSEVGRKHFVICFGYLRGAQVYLAFVGVSYVVIALLIGLEILPLLSAVALGGAAVGLIVFIKARHFSIEKLPEFLPFMGLNVAQTLLVPLIIAMSLFFV